MPGVPLDAFAQVKKGLKGMFRKRTKAAPNEKRSQSTAMSSEAGHIAPTVTSPAATAHVAASAKSEAAPVEMSSNEPVKIPMVECARGQEATSGAATTEGTVTTTNGTVPSTTTAAATTSANSPHPQFVVTPPSGEEEPRSIPRNLDQDIKPGKYDGSNTDVDAATTTKITPAAIIPPTAPVSDQDTSVSTPKLESERPASPAPKMSATSGPLDDHPTFT